MPCGSTGEAQTLDDHEREQVVGTVVEVAAGRVPVMAGATSNDTRRAVEETRRMCALGVDGILTATPYYNKPTQDGLACHFLAIAVLSLVNILGVRLGKGTQNLLTAGKLAGLGAIILVGFFWANPGQLVAYPILGLHGEERDIHPKKKEPVGLGATAAQTPVEVKPHVTATPVRLIVTAKRGNCWLEVHSGSAT